MVLLPYSKLKKVAATGFPNNHAITKRYRSFGSVVDRMPKTDFRSVYKMTYGRRSPGIGLVFKITSGSTSDELSYRDDNEICLKRFWILISFKTIERTKRYLKLIWKLPLLIWKSYLKLIKYWLNKFCTTFYIRYCQYDIGRIFESSFPSVDFHKYSIPDAANSPYLMTVWPGVRGPQCVLQCDSDSCQSSEKLLKRSKNSLKNAKLARICQIEFTWCEVQSDNLHFDSSPLI